MLVQRRILWLYIQSGNLRYKKSTPRHGYIPTLLPSIEPRTRAKP